MILQLFGKSVYSIEVNDLNVTLGAYKALEGINFALEEDSFCVIVGPNGGGKTTLLKVLLNVEKPTSGTIRIFGADQSKQPKYSIGYVPQIKTLDRSFPATALELVSSGITGSWQSAMSKELRHKANEALALVGAELLAHRQLSKLSGGELQRIYLARSIARKPRMLFLDEPATGIDQAGAKGLIDLLDNYRNQTRATIVMVTHDLDSAYHHADRVLLINHKQLCFDRPKVALSECYLREVFGHIGHKHEMVGGGHSDD